MSNKTKIMDFLNKNPNKWVENTVVSESTGIHKSNMSKLYKALESENKIERRYEQVSRDRYVWIRLKKETITPGPKVKSDTNSQIINGEIKPKIEIKRKSEFSELERIDLLMCINNYLKGYKKRYETTKHDVLSESKIKYERIIRLREKFL